MKWVQAWNIVHLQGTQGGGGCQTSAPGRKKPSARRLINTKNATRTPRASIRQLMVRRLQPEVRWSRKRQQVCLYGALTFICRLTLAVNSSLLGPIMRFPFSTQPHESATYGRWRGGVRLSVSARSLWDLPTCPHPHVPRRCPKMKCQRVDPPSNRIPALQEHCGVLSGFRRQYCPSLLPFDLALWGQSSLWDHM